MFEIFQMLIHQITWLANKLGPHVMVVIAAAAVVVVVSFVIGAVLSACGCESSIERTIREDVEKSQSRKQ